PRACRLVCAERLRVQEPRRRRLMSVTDELLRNNEAHAGAFDTRGLPGLPVRKLVVLACMDPRLNPYAILGLRAGDAHILRNAGGVVTDDVIRSLAISQRLLGTEE